MKKILFCLMVLVLLAGCVQQEAADEGAPSAQEEAEAQERVEVQQVKSTNIEPEIVKAIEDQLTPAVKSVMPLTYRKMAYGDSYVFGLGVQNVNTYDMQYLVEIEFNKAYDKYTNKIDAVDEETVEGWIKTNFEVFELSKYEKKTVSVAVEVGNMAPGKKPVPGAYEFDVQVMSGKLSDALLNDEYTAKTKLTIKIA